MDKSILKIACVGNMNNFMFAVTRHLRRKGYQADLILCSEFDHFKPEADTFESSFSEFTKESDFLNSDILHTDKRKLNRFFYDYDFIIACGYAIAYLTYARVKIDIFIPYGSDLYDLPFFVPEDPENSYFNTQKTALARYQKRGIEQVPAIIFDYTNDEFEEVIEKFDLKGHRYKYSCPFIDTNEFNWSNKTQLQHKGKFTSKMLELRRKFDFIAFNHIRQSWKNPQDIWSYKGNERIFRAFKKFTDATGAHACLIVFEYGNDVEESKKYIAELGLTERVIWFPITERKEILSMISFCDVGIGEVGNYSWFSYGAIFEFLCMKKPVLHYRNDELYINKVESLYPMYSVSNEEEIEKALTDCYQDRAKTENIAEQAYDWYIENSINKPLSVIEREIASKNRIVNQVNKFMQKAILFFDAILFYIKLKST